MKKYFTLILSFILYSFSASSQIKSCDLITKTHALINKNHIYGYLFNETNAHQILNIYLESIDYDKIIFTQKDSLLIHNKINSATTFCAVFDIAKEIIIKKMRSHDSLISSFKVKELIDDKIIEKFDIPCENKHSSYKKDDKEMVEFVRKYFKYIFFQKLYLLKNAVLSTESEKIVESMKKKSSRNSEQYIRDENELCIVFIKAMCKRADPHSDFFEVNEKNQWLTHLSKEEYSFGFEIEITDNDLLKIMDILPGGAAWNSKQIENGDFISQIHLENGKKYIVGIDDNSLILEQIHSKENNEIIFQITRPKEGTKYVKIKKSITQVSENIINGYVFKVKNDNIGYIDLPSFYSSSNLGQSNGCASDLAREILQLKKDSIKALILDLRNNGGGYMNEALEIAGLFISEGILAIRHEKNDKPRYLKDPNRGTVYDDKLIILVNHHSASASELLAGTLQKYNRAIIVGNDTYGKGTMQLIYPLDSLEEIKKSNKFYVKLTTGKFYMVDKKTHQAKGILVDIKIPSLIDYLKSSKETDLAFHLQSDSINKTVPLELFKPINLNILQINSDIRLKFSNFKKNTKTLADSINYFDCRQKIELNKITIVEFESKKELFFSKLENKSIIDFKPYAIKNTSLYDTFLKKHEIHNLPNKLKIEQLNKDARLFETLNIASDFINLH